MMEGAANNFLRHPSAIVIEASSGSRSPTSGTGAPPLSSPASSPPSWPGGDGWAGRRGRDGEPIPQPVPVSKEDWLESDSTSRRSQVLFCYAISLGWGS